ncbi:MAG: DNA-deoxyinosine glycosylase [Burkholderiales bacterium RIFCSPHIGHO2_12_FULL_67_38]|nr:MAG: DNA-deoxyinosine glycosylase [Burkholderiales bacterium RIFCSPHIGHO2_12_FULL_67_38]
MSRLLGLAPVLDENTRLLVLGSFPGVASLRAQQYATAAERAAGRAQGVNTPAELPRIAAELARLRGMPLDALARASTANALAALRAHGLGLWDVYQACEREGSLDADIRAAELNDFAAVRTQCPLLEAVAHNGGESYRHARHTSAFGLPVYKLPSTSPANASWSFDRKLAAWAEVLLRHGVAV